jgi:hypothetical protein
MWTSLLSLGVFAVMAAALLWPRSDFVIRFRDGQVTCQGKLPLAQHAAIAHFILHDLNRQRPLTIRGTWSGRRLQLRFRGSISAGDQQCVRNFFASTDLY